MTGVILFFIDRAPVVDDWLRRDLYFFIVEKRVKTFVSSQWRLEKT